MPEQINWQQKRNVFINADGEFYVGVYRGWMAMEDYVGEGGPTYHAVEIGDLTLVGEFTNAEISQERYVTWVGHLPTCNRETADNGGEPICECPVE
jgi:hypothetical protein